MNSKPRMILYIDGFNLYKRRLEDNPHLKWLDLWALAENLLPGFEVVNVHYFTATLKPSSSPDPRLTSRQQVYMRALQARGGVNIHLGSFVSYETWAVLRPVATDITTGLFVTVPVMKFEEKGSDVNLAGQMLVDAHWDRADLYVMLTNDTDQVGTVRRMREDLGVRVGWVSTTGRTRDAKALLRTNPDYRGVLSDELLEASQLPDTLVDSRGTIRRPSAYASPEMPEAPPLAGPPNR